MSSVCATLPARLPVGSCRLTQHLSRSHRSVTSLVDRDHPESEDHLECPDHRDQEADVVLRSIGYTVNTKNIYYFKHSLLYCTLCHKMRFNNVNSKLKNRRPILTVYTLKYNNRCFRQCTPSVTLPKHSGIQLLQTTSRCTGMPAPDSMYLSRASTFHRESHDVN